MPKNALVFAGIAAIVLGLLALAAGLAGRLESPPDVTKTIASGSAATSSVIYSTTFPDIHGKPQMLGQWSQKLLVINFWATWCAPCVEEIPILVRLQDKYAANGLQIVGIAADNPANVANFAKKIKFNYPVLVDEAGAIEFAKRSGNRFGLLPYTIVLTAKGDILMTKLGIIVESDFENIIKNNLPK